MKPGQSPRMLDEELSLRQAEQKRAVQRAHSIIRRSKELVAQSAQIVAEVKRRTPGLIRAGGARFPAPRRINAQP